MHPLTTKKLRLMIDEQVAYLFVYNFNSFFSKKNKARMNKTKNQ